MPIFTEKEFSEKIKNQSKIKKKGSNLDKENSVQRTNGEFVRAPQVRFLYHLLHPENGVDDLQNFEDVITLDGKEYNRKCIQGIIKTDEQPLAEFLLYKGYKLMHKEKINGSSNIHRRTNIS